MHRYSDRMFLVFILILSFLTAIAYAVFCLVAGRFTIYRILLSFFGALAAVFLVSVLQFFLDPLAKNISVLLQFFFSAFIQAALVEEMIKLGCVSLIFSSDSKQKKTPFLLSGALLFALFFSSFETIAYGLSNPSVILVRVLTAVPLHGAATILAVSVLQRGEAKPAHPFLLLLLAIVGHGLFNVSMDIGGGFILIGCFSLLVLVGTAFWYFNLSKENQGR